MDAETRQETRRRAINVAWPMLRGLLEMEAASMDDDQAARNIRGAVRIVSAALLNAQEGEALAALRELPSEASQGRRATKGPRFGGRMRAVHASESNPHRDGFYVETVRRRGGMNPGVFYRITDGAGSFWECPRESVVVLGVDTSQFKCTEVLGWLRRQVDDYPAGLIGRSTLRKWIDAARDAHPALATPAPTEPAAADDGGVRGRLREHLRAFRYESSTGRGQRGLMEHHIDALVDHLTPLSALLRPTDDTARPVHNHGPEDGPGLACRESLIGDCLRASAGGEGERAQGSEEGKALAYAFDAICPTLTYTDPMQAARLIVDAYLRTEAVAVAAHVAATPETGSESHA